MIKYCRYCIRRFHKFFVGDFFWDSILSNLSSIYKMEKITVDQAIQRGQQMVNYPIFAIMIIGFGFSIYLVTILKSGWVVLIGFIATFVLSWLWWSYMITKWRVWAFENCRNVHELKRRAINEKLIWPDGSRFEKTEIRNVAQQKKIITINRKFQIADEPELIADDGTIPEETRIYYSKITLAIYWITGSGLFLFGVYLIVEGDILGYFSVVLSFFSLYYANKKSSMKEAYIILNAKGIKTLNTAFVNWENIKLIQTRLIGMGKNATWHLIVKLKNKDSQGNWGDDIEIVDLSISPKKIEKLIKLYQQRNRDYR